LFSAQFVHGQIMSDFESGFLKYRNQVVNKSDDVFQFDHNSLYSKFDLGYKHKGFKVVTETSIFFHKKELKDVSFSPTFSEFIFTASYSLKNIEIGYEHLCGHPIVNSYSDYNKSIKFAESYEKFFIKIKIR